MTPHPIIPELRIDADHTDRGVSLCDCYNNGGGWDGCNHPDNPHRGIVFSCAYKGDKSRCELSSFAIPESFKSERDKVLDELDKHCEEKERCYKEMHIKYHAPDYFTREIVYGNIREFIKELRSQRGKQV